MAIAPTAMIKMRVCFLLGGAARFFIALLALRESCSDSRAANRVPSLFLSGTQSQNAMTLAAASLPMMTFRLWRRYDAAEPHCMRGQLKCTYVLDGPLGFSQLRVVRR